MPKKASVAILVLNFNGKRFLRGCLASLRITDWPHKTYLVDNGSTDGSVEFVRAGFPEVDIVRYPNNNGFCQAYNRVAVTIPEEYLLFMNNDTSVVHSCWLGNMMHMILDDDRVGAVGAKLVTMSNPKIIDSVGGSAWRWSGIGIRIGAGEVDVGQYEKPSEPFCVLGATLLIKRSLFLSVGGFDPEMFAYSEELDLCWRLRLLGYRIKYCPTALVHHYSSGSWQSMKSFKFYLASRNFLRSCAKNYSFGSFLRELPPYLVVNVLGLIYASVATRNSGLLKHLIQGIGWNLANLRSALAARAIIQSRRSVEEAKIIEAMGRTPIGDLRILIKGIREDETVSLVVR